jgi:hypothetical protein
MFKKSFSVLTFVAVGAGGITQTGTPTSQKLKRNSKRLLLHTRFLQIPRSEQRMIDLENKGCKMLVQKVVVVEEEASQGVASMETHSISLKLSLARDLEEAT